MGQLIHFYVGDSTAIGEAFTNNDFDKLNDPNLVKACADFSLHLDPEALDILSGELHELLGQPRQTLTDCLGNSVGGDSESGESYAHEVSYEWVALVASFPADRINELAAKWGKALSAHYGDEIEPNEEMKDAVGDLISACKTSLSSPFPLVNTWSL